MKKLIGVSLVSALMLMSSSSFAQGKKMMRAENVKAKMEKIIADLDLSDEQTEQVKAIFKAKKANLKEGKVSKEEMQKLSEEDRKIEIAKMKLKRAEAAKTTKMKMAEVLSAEQLEKFEAIKGEQKEELQDLKKERIEHKPQKEDMHQEEPNKAN
tara:strand:+ start:29554 stop:30018 length:465 start_codon:yes stop_codon:yes gene_type:complete